MEGQLVESVDELVNNSNFVMAGYLEVFKSVTYNINNYQTKLSRGAYGLKGSTMHNELVARIRYPRTQTSRKSSVGSSINGDHPQTIIHGRYQTSVHRAHFEEEEVNKGML